MALTRQEVLKIAQLARLAVTEQEAASYAASLSRILGLIEQMNAVDTTGIEPMAHPTDSGLRLRADEVSEPNQRDKFQAVAPAVEAGLYLVPKVIE
jgi:aspartyl-tRNA(Asn)/glutamyl-tRNA(Gln) amidotransferase subunit C